MIRPVLAAGLLGGLAAAVCLPTGPPVTASAAPAGPAVPQPAKGKRYAVLIGVNQYNNRNLTDLRFAERDVTALADVFRQAGFDRVTVLLGSAAGADQATPANIQDAVDDLLGKPDPDPNKAMLKKPLVTAADTLVVGFAGHGFQFAPPNQREQPFLGPVGADPTLPGTLVPLNPILAAMNSRGAGRNLVLVDACRDDPTPGRSGIDGKTVTLSEGVACFFACNRGQRALESPQFGDGHGAFFHAVLTALRGGVAAGEEVSWDDLIPRVKRQVRDDVARVFPQAAGSWQIPHQVGSLAGLAVLVRGQPAARPQPREWVAGLVGRRLADLKALARGRPDPAVAVALTVRHESAGAVADETPKVVVSELVAQLSAAARGAFRVLSPDDIAARKAGDLPPPGEPDKQAAWLKRVGADVGLFLTLGVDGRSSLYEISGEVGSQGVEARRVPAEELLPPGGRAAPTGRFGVELLFPEVQVRRAADNTPVGPPLPAVQVPLVADGRPNGLHKGKLFAVVPPVPPERPYTIRLTQLKPGPGGPGVTKAVVTIDGANLFLIHNPATGQFRPDPSQPSAATDGHLLAPPGWATDLTPEGMLVLVPAAQAKPGAVPSTRVIDGFRQGPFVSSIIHTRPDRSIAHDAGAGAAASIGVICVQFYDRLRPADPLTQRVQPAVNLPPVLPDGVRYQPRYKFDDDYQPNPAEVVRVYYVTADELKTLVPPADQKELKPGEVP